MAQTNTPSEPAQAVQTKQGKLAIKVQVSDLSGTNISKADVSAVNQAIQEKQTGITDAKHETANSMWYYASAS
jgi:hypothetical protein